MIRRIGAGGFGVVYLANDRRLGRRVALKLAHPGRGDLWREARAAARLSHPNVVAIHEIGEHEGSAYLVMEHVDGPTLRDRIDRERLPLAEALRIARELASAIAAAHREGIIHLDLTPSNVLLAPDGRARVVDFGLARASDTFGARVDDVGEPQLSIAAGTPTYMAPEQWRAEKLGPPADVWALGTITHVLVTGVPPVDGSTDLVRDRVAGAAALELSTLGALPGELAALIRRCLDKDPGARPLAEEVATALDALAAQLRMPSPFRDGATVPRATVIAELAALVRHERAVAVTGPAGCGKSTLATGLVAALRAGGWNAMLVRPGARPLHAIATALRANVSGAIVATRSDLGAAPTTIDEQLARWDVPERFAADLEDAATAVGRLAIVIDPVAELDDAATACLAAAIADDGVAHVVLVGESARLAATRFAVPPPTHAELVAMLEQPVTDAGYRFADGLAANVAKDVAAHPTPLAQLAAVGATLWDGRDRETRTIPYGAYGRKPRRVLRIALAAAAIVAAVITVFAFATHDGTTAQATASTQGPQCVGVFFKNQAVAKPFSVAGRQDALAGVTSDGKAMLIHRRDCATDDWQLALVEDGGKRTFILNDVPALAALEPKEMWATLSGDGLTVIGTDREHRRLLSSTRTSRDRADFSPLAPNAFAAITVDGLAWISHPTISQDGLELFYTVHDEHRVLERRTWIHTSRRRSLADPFPAGTPVGIEFHNMEHTTAITADNRTLFVGAGYGLAMFTRASRDDKFVNANFPLSAPTVPGFRTRPVGDGTYLVGTCISGCNSEDVCVYSR